MDLCGRAKVEEAVEHKDGNGVTVLEEQQCSVCWGLLIEPVAWPGCSHTYCLVCALRTRLRPTPACPLCRQPAQRARKSAELQVDAARAAQVRRCIGYSKYETHRRDLWAEAASLDAHGELGELPLCCMGPWHFPAGSRQQLRVSEPRYREMVRRALAPGGGRRLAVVLQPPELEVGAKGRVCEIVEGSQDLDGDWHVILEGGAACKVLQMAAEEVQPGGEPLFHGALEEVAEEELSGPPDSSPLVAASEMVDILSTLGRHLRAMRRRRLMMRLAGDLEDGDEPLMSSRSSASGVPAALHLPIPRAALGDDEDPLPLVLASSASSSSGFAGDGGAPSGHPELRESLEDAESQGMGAMLSLLSAYRQIITQMDDLLSEASHTAERLAFAEATVHRTNAVEPQRTRLALTEDAADTSTGRSLGARPRVNRLERPDAGFVAATAAQVQPPLSPRNTFDAVQSTLRGFGTSVSASSPSNVSSLPMVGTPPGAVAASDSTSAVASITSRLSSSRVATVANARINSHSSTIAASAPMPAPSSDNSAIPAAAPAPGLAALAAATAPSEAVAVGASRSAVAPERMDRLESTSSRTSSAAALAAAPAGAAAAATRRLSGAGNMPQSPQSVAPLRRSRVANGGSGSVNAGRRGNSAAASPASTSGSNGFGLLHQGQDFLPLATLRGGNNASAVAGVVSVRREVTSRPTSGNGVAAISLGAQASPASPNTSSSAARRIAGRARQAAVFAQAAMSTFPGSRAA